jgi:hypothetical protein
MDELSPPNINPILFTGFNVIEVPILGEGKLGKSRRCQISSWEDKGSEVEECPGLASWWGDSTTFPGGVVVSEEIALAMPTGLHARDVIRKATNRKKMSKKAGIFIRDIPCKR